MTARPEEAALISPAIALEEYPQPQTLKLGVLASGSGSNFEAIARAIQAGKLNAQIQVLIYNNPQAKAAARADSLGIPSVLLDHRQYPTREDLDRAIIQTFKESDADWAILAGWMRIVTPVLIEAFPQRILNIHPSILPSFRGLHAIEQALASSAKVAGCTVHYVTPEVDSGAILMQAVVPILEGDTAETLHARVQVQEHRIFPAAIALAGCSDRH